MANPVAVLVEDDPQQSDISKDVLTSARFDVRVFDSIAPARMHLNNSSELVDLFVLDRRLPVNAGEPATDELGDELLREIRVSFPDARLIVFTGYADVRHVQNALRGGGQLLPQERQSIDRITVLEKSQSLEFKQHVEEFRYLLQLLDDIEIVASDGNAPPGDFDKRVIRRLALAHQAVSVSVSTLGGGLTDASVWRCELRTREGPVASVAAKLVKKPTPLGGLPALLPRASTTPTIATISGLIGGRYINVLQLAGSDPYALITLVSEDPSKAAQLARPIWDALREVPSQEMLVSVAELSKSLIDWAEIVNRLEPHGIHVPAGSLTVTTRIGLRHGDLHPGNVLIDDDQAVLIDFDSCSFASALLDPVTMLISTLVHPASPIRGSRWPQPDEITARLGTADFARGHVCETWFRELHNWVAECRSSDREFWALALAYSARQLAYPDVHADPAVMERVIAIANRSAEALAGT